MPAAISSAGMTVTRAANQPTFRVELRPEPGVVDPTHALRRGLRILLRAFGLRAVSAVELPPDDGKQQ
jgi:hypothetical protein